MRSELLWLQVERPNVPVSVNRAHGSALFHGEWGLVGRERNRRGAAPHRGWIALDAETGCRCGQEEPLSRLGALDVVVDLSACLRSGKPSGLAMRPVLKLEIRGEPKKGAFLILSLGTASSATRDLVFLSQSWSRCPAENWVPALLEGEYGRVR